MSKKNDRKKRKRRERRNIDKINQQQVLEKWTEPVYKAINEHRFDDAERILKSCELEHGSEPAFFKLSTFLFL